MSNGLSDVGDCQAQDELNANGAHVWLQVKVNSTKKVIIEETTTGASIILVKNGRAIAIKLDDDSAGGCAGDFGSNISSSRCCGQPQYR